MEKFKTASTGSEDSTVEHPKNLNEEDNAEVEAAEGEAKGQASSGTTQSRGCSAYTLEGSTEATPAPGANPKAGFFTPEGVVSHEEHVSRWKRSKEIHGKAPRCVELKTLEELKKNEVKQVLFGEAELIEFVPDGKDFVEAMNEAEGS